MYLLPGEELGRGELRLRSAQSALARDGSLSSATMDLCRLGCVISTLDRRRRPYVTTFILRVRLDIVGNDI